MNEIKNKTPPMQYFKTYELIQLQDSQRTVYHAAHVNRQKKTKEIEQKKTFYCVSVDFFFGRLFVLCGPESMQFELLESITKCKKRINK